MMAIVNKKQKLKLENVECKLYGRDGEGKQNQVAEIELETKKQNNKRRRKGMRFVTDEIYLLSFYLLYMCWVNKKICLKENVER